MCAYGVVSFEINVLLAFALLASATPYRTTRSPLLRIRIIPLAGVCMFAFAVYVNVQGEFMRKLDMRCQISYSPIETFAAQLSLTKHSIATKRANRFSANATDVHLRVFPFCERRTFCWASAARQQFVVVVVDVLRWDGNDNHHQHYPNPLAHDTVNTTEIAFG